MWDAQYKTRHYKKSEQSGITILGLSYIPDKIPYLTKRVPRSNVIPDKLEIYFSDIPIHIKMTLSGLKSIQYFGGHPANSRRWHNAGLILAHAGPTSAQPWASASCLLRSIWRCVSFATAWVMTHVGNLKPRVHIVQIRLYPLCHSKVAPLRQWPRINVLRATASV